jgi:hypothetical protein
MGVYGCVLCGVGGVRRRRRAEGAPLDFFGSTAPYQNAYSPYSGLASLACPQRARFARMSTAGSLRSLSPPRLASLAFTAGSLRSFPHTLPLSLAHDCPHCQDYLTATRPHATSHAIRRSVCVYVPVLLCMGLRWVSLWCYGVCLCLSKQRRLVLDIYRPSATALATVGSQPARVLPRPAVPKRGCGLSRYWFVLEVVSCDLLEVLSKIQFISPPLSSPLPLQFLSACNKNL